MSSMPDEPAEPAVRVGAGPMIRPLEAYAFANADDGAADRHRHLAEMLDEPTTALLAGLGDLTGARCLELGAGGGSIARLLAELAGPTGRVLATDLDTRYLAMDAGHEVLRHDLVTEPVPEGPWDVIHARLVLLHLPGRREILHGLAEALAPGGALIIEDFETTFGKLVLRAPTPEAAALIDTYQRALIGTVLPAHGNDPAWAGRVHDAMADEGLIDVETVIQARSWPGGTAGALLVEANIAQAGDRLIEAGMSQAQLDELRRLVHDPRLVLRGHFVYSTVGRRPRG